MKIERKTIAIILIAAIGMGLFVGLASAAPGENPLTRIMEILTGINTKLDTVASTNSINFYQNGVDLAPSPGRMEYVVLDFEEGKTYHVHMTGVLASLDEVGFYISAGNSQYTGMTMYHKEGPSEENLNLDFVCNRLSIVAINREVEESSFIAIFTIEYEVCTNVVDMP